MDRQMDRHRNTSMKIMIRYFKPELKIVVNFENHILIKLMIYIYVYDNLPNGCKDLVGNRQM